MARLRELTLGDLDAVGDLFVTAGWPRPALTGWRRLWVDNPALAWDGPKLCMGWVLEEGPRIGGFLANLAQTYQFGDRTLRTAVAASLVVDKEFRGSSMQLVATYAKQDHVDLLLNTTAAAHVVQLFRFLKFEPLPQEDYQRNLFWVLRSSAFLNAALRKKGFSRFVSRVGGVTLAPALWARGVLRGQGLLGRTPYEVRILGGEELGQDFDDLWERKLREGQRLLAHRTAKTLQWHFAPAGRSHPLFLACAYDKGLLKGYMAVVRQDAPHIDLKRARVADIFVEQDDPEVIRLLLGAVLRHARTQGADMLEVIGFPDPIRSALLRCRPFERHEEASPFLYKVLRPELHQALSAPDLWYASLYDGDGSL
jgi:hypothetical protein